MSGSSPCPTDAASRLRSSRAEAAIARKRSPRPRALFTTASSPSSPGRSARPSDPCSPSNCSARHQSLRTTPIIVKDRAMLRSVAVLLLCPLLAASALAQSAGEPLDAPLKIAQAEQAAAEAETAKLENAASQ